MLYKLKVKEDEAETNDVAATGTDGTPAAKKKDEKKQVAKPQAVLDFEKKNAGKKKVKFRDGSTGG